MEHLVEPSYGGPILPHVGSSTSFEVEKDSMLSCLIEVLPALADNELGWFQFDCFSSGKVVVSAMNQVLSIKSTTSVLKVENSIRFKVPGRQLVEYLKQLSSQCKISFKIDIDQRVHVKSGRSRGSFPIVQDTNEVVLNIPENVVSIKVNPDQLEEWISSFRDFVLVEDSRFYANGALVICTKSNVDKISAVASDSLRLAKSSVTCISVAIPNGETQKILVPRKVLDELKRLGTHTQEGEIEIRIDEASLTFAVKTTNYLMSAKCIAGVYPPYESAIPRDIKFTATISVTALTESLKRVIIFDTYCNLKFSQNTLSVSCVHKADEADEWIELDSLSPSMSTFEVKYNAKHLLSILSHISSENIKFGWENTHRPVIITSSGESNSDTFYLLVPMNI